MTMLRSLITPAILLAVLSGCDKFKSSAPDAAVAVDPTPAVDAAVAAVDLDAGAAAAAAAAAAATLDASVAAVPTALPIVGACKPGDLGDCANKCEKLKNQSSCVNLGIMFQNGEGGAARDNNKATTLFQGACNANIGAGCERFGIALHNGSGIVADVPRAAVTFQKGCDLRNAVSCNQLALMNVRGEGVPKDTVKAVSLYQKSCDLGDAFGCGNLANHLASGDGVARDPARAAALRRAAGDKGDRQACRALNSPDPAPTAAAATTTPTSVDPTAAECAVMRRNFIDNCKKDCAVKTAAQRTSCEAVCGPSSISAPALAKCKAFRKTE